MKYVHFWKRFISDRELQEFIDTCRKARNRFFFILLEEKLRRVEGEISIA